MRVLPTVPTSNTMWTMTMVAERIGASIREGLDLAEWKDRGCNIGGALA